VAATESLIVGLFSGRGILDSRSPESTTLHYFSWDGELLGEQQLDRPVVSIALGNDGTLYGVLRTGAVALFVGR
jgi:hypothetical protein